MNSLSIQRSKPHQTPNPPQNDQQHSPEFLKINPRGEVPVLVDGDKVFSDSSSILVWLAGKSKSSKVSNNDNNNSQPQSPGSYWSSDLYEQAKIVDWVRLQSDLSAVAVLMSSFSCRSRTVGCNTVRSHPPTTPSDLRVPLSSLSL